MEVFHHTVLLTIYQDHTLVIIMEVEGNLEQIIIIMEETQMVDKIVTHIIIHIIKDIDFRQILIHIPMVVNRRLRNQELLKKVDTRMITIMMIMVIKKPLHPLLRPLLRQLLKNLPLLQLQCKLHLLPL